MKKLNFFLFALGVLLILVSITIKPFPWQMYLIGCTVAAVALIWGVLRVTKPDPFKRVGGPYGRREK